MDRLQPDLGERRDDHERQRRGDRALKPDRGAGLVGAIGGVTVFLAFLFFAVQLLFNLYATSVVTSTAHDGARLVAGSQIDHADASAVVQARADAEDHMRELLGDYGERVSFDWSASTADTVSLRIRARNPRLTFGGLSGHLGFDEIDRTISMRVEQPQ